MPIKRVRRFKVYCTKDLDGPFFMASIYPTKAGMVKRVRDMGYEAGDLFNAICLSFSTFSIDEFGKEEPGQCIGEMVFHMDFLKAGVVSHECVHAAMRYAEYLKINVTDPVEVENGHTTPADHPEEVMAWTQGWMVSQIWNYYYDNIMQ